MNKRILISLLLLILVFALLSRGGLSASFATYEQNVDECTETLGYSITLNPVTKKSTLLTGEVQYPDDNLYFMKLQIIREVNDYINGAPYPEYIEINKGGYSTEIPNQAAGTAIKVVLLSYDSIEQYEIKACAIQEVTLYEPPVKKKSKTTIRIDAKSEAEVKAENEPKVEEVVIVEDLLRIEEDIIPHGLVKFSEAYVTGYPDGTFRPDSYVSRGEVATIFARILGLETSTVKGENPKYKDLSEKDWYYEYIHALEYVDIVQGYDDFTFKAENTVTHGEIAAMISRYWDYIGEEVSASDAGVKDVSGTWSIKYVNQMYNAELISTNESPCFKPNEPTTRAELVVWINQLVGRCARRKAMPTYNDVDPSEKIAPDIESASYEWK